MKRITLLFLIGWIALAFPSSAQQSAAVVMTATWKDQATQDRIVLAVSKALPEQYLKFRRLNDEDPANDRADNRATRTNFAERMAARHLLELTRGVELLEVGETARTTKKAEQDAALVEQP